MRDSWTDDGRSDADKVEVKCTPCCVCQQDWWLMARKEERCQFLAWLTPWMGLPLLRFSTLVGDSFVLLSFILLDSKLLETTSSLFTIDPIPHFQGGS